jgi:hypothetical protein
MKHGTHTQDGGLWEFSASGSSTRVGPLPYHLGSPRGVAIDLQGRIVVADASGRVLRLSAARDKWTVLARRGDRPVTRGERANKGAGTRGGAQVPALVSPVGVAVDSESNVYVADAKAHAVFVIVERNSEHNSSLQVVAGDGRVCPLSPFHLLPLSLSFSLETLAFVLAFVCPRVRLSSRL